MQNYKRLVKVFMTQIKMSRPQDARRRIKFLVWGFFAVFGILLPSVCGAGFIVNLMTGTLQMLGKQTAGLELFLYLISVFTVIFGMSVVLNELFFSSDIPFLLPLPLKGEEIAAAKFTAAVLNENLMQIFLVFASIIGYETAVGVRWQDILFSLVCGITLPVIPMLYCAVIGFVIMRFTKMVKNKDQLSKIMGAVLVVIVVALLLSVGFLKDMDISHYVESLANTRQPVIEVFHYVFPHIFLFMEGLRTGNLWYLLGYLLLHVVYIGVFLLCAHYMYLDAVQEKNGYSGGKKTELDRVIAKSRVHSPGMAYFLKEAKMLLRTPVFFLNCVVINFVWPVFIFAIYKLQSGRITITDLRNLFKDGDARVHFILFIGVLAISVLMTAINSIGSNAFSREGKQFSFIKYIPVSYRKQWDMKVLLSILFSGFSIWIFIIAVCIIIRISVITTIGYLLLSVISISLISNMGVLMDSYQPKLVWDDELSALRENFNTFFAMALAMLILFVLFIIDFLLFTKVKLAMGTIYLITMILLVAGHVYVYQMTAKTGIRNISEQEEV